MLSRGLYILFILFEAFFLNVAVPGHTRGEITVPGYRPSTTMMRTTCCAMEHHPDQSRPTPADQAHCAMCFFAAGLCVPPPAVFAPTPWDKVISCRPVHAESADFKAHPLPWHGRAPPAGTLFA